MKKKPAPLPSARQTFSQNVRLARRVKEFSQEHLSELSEVDRTYISEIEGGTVAPSIEVCERLARALGFELRDMLDVDFSLDAIIGREK